MVRKGTDAHRLKLQVWRGKIWPKFEEKCTWSLVFSLLCLSEWVVLRACGKPPGSPRQHQHRCRSCGWLLGQALDHRNVECRELLTALPCWQEGKEPSTQPDMLCTWRSLPSQAGNKVNTPGIQQNPKDDVKLYKSNVGASADSTGLMFFTSDLGKKEDSCWDKELVLSSNYFSSKRLVSGSFSQQNGALLPLCLCWSLLLCVREWAVSVGGWCADSTSLQIICRLQVKCRSESITEQELVFILR